MAIANANTIVIPGHGPVADCDALIQFHQMLQTIEHRVLTFIQKGLSVSEVIAASSAAEFDSVWGKGYVTGAHFTRMVLAGLQYGERSTTGATN